MVMPFLHTGCKRAPLLPETEEPMITIDFITALFYEVDEQMRPIPKHPEAHLWPSEVVTLGLLHALKGGGNRPFYRWLTRDYRALFPRLPERTRLFPLGGVGLSGDGPRGAGSPGRWRAAGRHRRVGGTA